MMAEQEIIRRIRVITLFLEKRKMSEFPALVTELRVLNEILEG